MAKIELTTAEQEILNGIATTLAPPVLTEYPTTDASKAGRRFSFQGEDWEYLTQEKITANNWDLPVGTPWPVKGCKELIIRFLRSGSGQTSNEIFKDETGLLSLFSFFYPITTLGTDNNLMVRVTESGDNFIDAGETNIEILSYPRLTLIQGLIDIRPSYKFLSGGVSSPFGNNISFGVTARTETSEGGPISPWSCIVNQKFYPPLTS